MQILTKSDFSYPRAMLGYAALTFLSTLGCSLLGYIALPFAAAFFATLLILENPAKRVISYVLPVVIFLVNLLLRGIYSLEAIAYLIVGLAIYFCVKRNKSKGETAFWIGFSVLVCIILSAFLLLIELSRAAETTVSSFYFDGYHKYKEFFLDTLTSLVYEDADGVQSFAYNLYEAKMLFRELIIYLIPITILISFTISGLTLKIFCRSVAKNSRDDSEIYAWNFGTSNIVSYFFIALSAVALMASFDGSTFAYVIFTLNTLFTAVFSYIGLKSLYYIIISRGKSRFFAIVLIIIIFALLSSLTFQLLSYFGVIINIITNKALKNKQRGN